MKQIGLVVKMDDRAAEKADKFEAWLHDRGTEVLRVESSSLQRVLSEKQISVAPPDLFCVFVLGGDGTFLSAVRWIGNQDVPILGVKFGEVGFLAETAENNLFKSASAVLDNKFIITPRMRLQVRVIRGGKDIANETVLNDVVINRGALARLAHIQTCIDQDYLTTYRADGLIVATPTGSTAYSLAAGGPIIHPEVPAIILTPICPFTLTNRPLIIPDSACIKIKLEKKPADIMLTFDGQLGLEIDGRDSIVVQKAEHPVKMISLPEQHYFETLKTKLRWGGQ